LTKHERHVNKVKEIFDELMSAHPEFAARKRVVMQRKAEREERERLKKQVPPMTA